MQDRYSGDVGDFGKLALLRALGPGKSIGVCWYLTSGAGETNRDGRHTAYIDHPRRFRYLDPPLFDALSRFRAAVDSGLHPRSVVALEAALEIAKLLPASTRFHRTLCPDARAERASWRVEMVAAMADTELVLLDPDNGLEAATLTNKSAALDDLQALRRPNRALLLYHHQTRFTGGAEAEVSDLRSRLEHAGFGPVEAVRLRPYSSRYYFLLAESRSCRAWTPSPRTGDARPSVSGTRISRRHLDRGLRLQNSAGLPQRTLQFPRRGWRSRFIVAPRNLQKRSSRPRNIRSPGRHDGDRGFRA